MLFKDKGKTLQTQVTYNILNCLHTYCSDSVFKKMFSQSTEDDDVEVNKISFYLQRFEVQNLFPLLSFFKIKNDTIRLEDKIMCVCVRAYRYINNSTKVKSDQCLSQLALIVSIFRNLAERAVSTFLHHRIKKIPISGLFINLSFAFDCFHKQ
jgi:hypothetical protein